MIQNSKPLHQHEHQRHQSSWYIPEVFNHHGVLTRNNCKSDSHHDLLQQQQQQQQQLQQQPNNRLSNNINSTEMLLVSEKRNESQFPQTYPKSIQTNDATSRPESEVLLEIAISHPQISPIVHPQTQTQLQSQSHVQFHKSLPADLTCKIPTQLSTPITSPRPTEKEDQEEYNPTAIQSPSQLALASKPCTKQLIHHALDPHLGSTAPPTSPATPALPIGPLKATVIAHLDSKKEEFFRLKTKEELHNVEKSVRALYGAEFTNNRLTVNSQLKHNKRKSTISPNPPNTTKQTHHIFHTSPKMQHIQTSPHKKKMRTTPPHTQTNEGKHKNNFSPQLLATSQKSVKFSEFPGDIDPLSSATKPITTTTNTADASKNTSVGKQSNGQDTDTLKDSMTQNSNYLGQRNPSESQTLQLSPSYPDLPNDTQIKTFPIREASGDWHDTTNPPNYLASTLSYPQHAPSGSHDYDQFHNSHNTEMDPSGHKMAALNQPKPRREQRRISTEQEIAQDLYGMNLQPGYVVSGPDMSCRQTQDGHHNRGIAKVPGFIVSTKNRGNVVCLNCGRDFWAPNSRRHANRCFQKPRTYFPEIESKSIVSPLSSRTNSEKELHQNRSHL